MVVVVGGVFVVVFLSQSHPKTPELFGAAVDRVVFVFKCIVVLPHPSHPKVVVVGGVVDGAVVGK